jgi:transposase
VDLAAWLSKELGVPAGKLATLLGQLGIQVTPGGVGQAVPRATRRAQPTDQALAAGVRASPVVTPDETGWRVGGGKAWPAASRPVRQAPRGAAAARPPPRRQGP